MRLIDDLSESSQSLYQSSTIPTGNIVNPNNINKISKHKHFMERTKFAVRPRADQGAAKMEMAGFSRDDSEKLFNIKFDNANTY